MKRIVGLMVVIAICTFSFGQRNNRNAAVVVNFADASSEYATIMSNPTQKKCSSFIDKYSYAKFSDTTESKWIKKYLVDVNDINEKTQWWFLTVISNINDTKNHGKIIPINVLRIYNMNKNINKLYKEAIFVNDDKHYIAFKDTFNLYRLLLCKERDSLLKSNLISFQDDNQMENYILLIGFDKSVMLYKKAHKHIQKAVEPNLSDIFKDNTTNIPITDLKEFTYKFNNILSGKNTDTDNEDGNPTFDNNLSKYKMLCLTMYNDNSIDGIISLFDLNGKYSTALQKENFKKSDEYQLYKNKKDSLRKIEFSKIYSIDLEKTDNKVVLGIYGNFIISDYDLTRKGFNIFFNTYQLKKSSFITSTSTDLPKIISRVAFDFIPFTNSGNKTSQLGYVTTGDDNNILFVHMDKDKGSKIESSKIAIEILFQLNNDIKSAAVDGVLPYLIAKKCKLVIYDINTEEILFSKLYSINDNPNLTIKKQ